MSEPVSQPPAAELSSNWQNASKNKDRPFCNHPSEMEHSQGQCQDPRELLASGFLGSGPPVPGSN